MYILKHSYVKVQFERKKFCLWIIFKVTFGELPSVFTHRSDRIWPFPPPRRLTLHRLLLDTYFVLTTHITEFCMILQNFNKTHETHAIYFVASHAIKIIIKMAKICRPYWYCNCCAMCVKKAPWLEWVSFIKPTMVDNVYLQACRA